MAWALVNRQTGRAVIREGRDLQILWVVDLQKTAPIDGDTVNQDEFLGAGKFERIDDAGPYPFIKLREQMQPAA